MYTGASYYHAGRTPMRSGMMCDNINILGIDEMNHIKGSLTKF